MKTPLEYKLKYYINKFWHNGEKAKIENNILKGKTFEEFLEAILNNNGVEVFYKTGKNRQSGNKDRVIDFGVKFKTRPNAWAFIECKYHGNVKDISFNKKIKLAKDENQFNKYKKIQKLTNIPVFIFIGINGHPYEPELIYLIPLDKLNSHIVSFRQLSYYNIIYFDDMKYIVKKGYQNYYRKHSKSVDEIMKILHSIATNKKSSKPKSNRQRLKKTKKK